MLKLIGGIMRPARGDIRVAGWSQAHALNAYRREVFWCGPEPLAMDHLRVSDYVDRIKGRYPRFSPAAVAHDAELLGLRPHLERPIGRLPTALQNRVWLMAALAAGATLTLLDEPFRELDPGHARHLSQRLADLARLPDRAVLIAEAGSDAHAGSWRAQVPHHVWAI